MYLMKIQISYVFREKIKYVFNENTDQFCLEKKSDLKIQISFVQRKKKKKKKL